MKTANGTIHELGFLVLAAGLDAVTKEDRYQGAEEQESCPGMEREDPYALGDVRIRVPKHVLSVRAAESDRVNQASSSLSFRVTGLSRFCLSRGLTATPGSILRGTLRGTRSVGRMRLVIKRFFLEQDDVVYGFQRAREAAARVPELGYWFPCLATGARGTTRGTCCRGMGQVPYPINYPPVLPHVAALRKLENLC